MKYGLVPPKWHADDANGLGDILPFAAADTHAIGEMQPVGFGAQINRGDVLATASRHTSQSEDSPRGANGSRRSSGKLPPSCANSRSVELAHAEFEGYGHIDLISVQALWYCWEW